MFQKGVSGNPAGKPKGTKDHRWHDLQFWFALITENKKYMKANELVELGKWGMAILIGKMNSIPATPAESKANVDAELLQAEGYGINRNGNPPTEPGSNGAHVGNGTTQS